MSTDVGTQAGRFDVATVGAYESEVWADRDFLTPLTDMPSGFNAEDFIPAVRDALSDGDELQAAPLYGESMVTMYRQDVLAEAGVAMPDEPTWDDILAAAEELDAAGTGDTGDTSPICIRGKAGSGENVALLSSMAHAYGARWFDEDWTPQLDSEEWTETFSDYVGLAQYAGGDIAEMGYQENLEAFAAGDCAIWTDTTVAASYLTDPATSEVADDVAFAAAPRHGSGRETHWLWTWALAIPDSSTQKDLAKKFIIWATSNDYTELAAEHFGWANVPPGAREETYARQEYLDAAPFAPLVHSSIEAADITDPADGNVPYLGIQYVAVPQFQGIGTSVGQQLTDAITGTTSLEDVQENSQWVAERITERSQMTDESNETD
ncbi:MAG: ABC transporter substrate-binding protein [Corynebacterium variabile]|uniref:ABC transporter substrate-binding protein n=1 Tax=Corynebacterium variabile TaxID=1727 RepID=UPI003F8D99F7